MHAQVQQVHTDNCHWTQTEYIRDTLLHGRTDTYGMITQGLGKQHKVAMHVLETLLNTNCWGVRMK